MYKAVQTCKNCGADLTLDDMRGSSCPYCNVVYPHHSQAIQHAQVIEQVMGGMMGRRPAGPPGAPPGGPPPVGGPPMGAPPSPYGTHGAPGPFNPSGAPGQPSPYGQPPANWGGYNQMVQQQMDQAQRMSSRIMKMVLVSTVLGLVVTFGIVALVFFAR